jgi:hypothetical protein
MAPCRSLAPRSRFIECDLDAFELVGGHFSCEAENGTARRHVANLDLRQDAGKVALMILRNDPWAAN